MPLHFFFFFKTPISVLKQLTRIQRDFLWGGGMEDKKLCWVKWDHICLPKDQGGLRVKILELFNTALLCKWKWRFLMDKEATWVDLMSSRYGHISTKLSSATNNQFSSKDSIWWKDIIGMRSRLEDDWFKINVRSCVSDGNNIGF
jgi:hypothetical protein